VKITKSQLKQIIEAELEEAGYRQAVVDGRTGKVIRPAGPIDDEDAATGASHSAEVGIDYETGAGHSADVYDQDGNLIKKGAPLGGDAEEDPHDKLARMLKARGVEPSQKPGESDKEYWKRREREGMTDLFKSGIPQRARRNLNRQESKMKITKSQLKKIIAEEMAKLGVDEAFGRATSASRPRTPRLSRSRVAADPESGSRADPPASGDMPWHPQGSKYVDQKARQSAGAGIGDLPPEAAEELSQLLNAPHVKAIQDEERRRVIMNYLIDHLKDKYGVGENPGLG